MACGTPVAAPLAPRPPPRRSRRVNGRGTRALSRGVLFVVAWVPYVIALRMAFVSAAKAPDVDGLSPYCRQTNQRSRPPPTKMPTCSSTITVTAADGSTTTTTKTETTDGVLIGARAVFSLAPRFRAPDCTSHNKAPAALLPLTGGSLSGLRRRSPTCAGPPLLRAPGKLRHQRTCGEGRAARGPVRSPR